MRNNKLRRLKLTEQQLYTLRIAMMSWYLGESDKESPYAKHLLELYKLLTNASICGILGDLNRKI